MSGIEYVALVFGAVLLVVWVSAKNWRNRNRK